MRKGKSGVERKRHLQPPVPGSVQELAERHPELAAYLDKVTVACAEAQRKLDDIAARLTHEREEYEAVHEADHEEIIELLLALDVTQKELGREERQNNHLRKENRELRLVILESSSRIRSLQTRVMILNQQLSAPRRHPASSRLPHWLSAPRVEHEDREEEVKQSDLTRSVGLFSSVPAHSASSERREFSLFSTPRFPSTQSSVTGIPYSSVTSSSFSA